MLSGNSMKIVLKELNHPNFVTFKIIRPVLINNRKRIDYYGFQREECISGNKIIDGLDFIYKNLDKNLIIPNKKNCTCKNYDGICLNCLMMINKKEQSACKTVMKRMNTIESIYPAYDMLESRIDINSSRFKYILNNTSDLEESYISKELYG